MVYHAYNPVLPQGCHVDAYGTVAGADTIIGKRQALDDPRVTTQQRFYANEADDPRTFGSTQARIRQGAGLEADRAQQASEQVQGRTGKIREGSTIICLLYTSPSPRD